MATPMTEQAERPVRVTIEGKGTLTPEGTIQVTVPDGDNGLFYVYCRPDLESVTVEWLWNWTDGDVVLDPEGDVAQRVRGEWCWVGESLVRSADAEATAWVEGHPERILRHQAAPKAFQTCEGGC